MTIRTILRYKSLLPEIIRSCFCAIILLSFTSTLSGAGIITERTSGYHSATATGKGKHLVRFMICTDVHKDIMHDADERLEEFIRDATGKKVDFIIQLGDFCRPYEYNLGFLKIWNSFPGEKHHVIGNHETDGGFSREDVIRYLNSPSKYYSFEKNGFHFIVLDGNDVNPSPEKAPGYARYIGEEQRKWLAADLESSQLPVILFSHQTLEGDGIENRQQIREILENENRSAGYKKVIACFSGHFHIDYATIINGISYIQINSMSNHWVGDKYQVVRYSAEIDKQFPYIKYTIPYRDPLYAYVEINDREIIIKGQKSMFVGPGPKEIGITGEAELKVISPFISNRKIKY